MRLVFSVVHFSCTRTILRRDYVRYTLLVRYTPLARYTLLIRYTLLLQYTLLLRYTLLTQEEFFIYMAREARPAARSAATAPVNIDTSEPYYGPQVVTPPQ